MTRTVTVAQLVWLLSSCSSNQASPPTTATTQPVATSGTSLQAHAGPVGTKLLRDVITRAALLARDVRGPRDAGRRAPDNPVLAA